MYEALIYASAISQILTLGILTYWVCVYVRLKIRLAYITSRLKTAMTNMDDLLDQLLEEPSANSSGISEKVALEKPDDVSRQHRGKLAALAAGGQANKYLGRSITTSQIDSMTDEEIERLYAHYETIRGAKMTKILGHSAVQAYARFASSILPIPPENEPDLVADLEDDPIIDEALNSVTCEIYHRSGMLLAPINILLTTVKYCRFKHSCPRNIPDDNVVEQQENVGVVNREGDLNQATGGC